MSDPFGAEGFGTWMLWIWLISPYLVTAIARIFESSRDIVDVCADIKYQLYQPNHELSFISPVALLLHVMTMADDNLPGDVTLM
jgi:hypothetical protein